MDQELFDAAMKELPAMAERRALIGERLLGLFEADRDESVIGIHTSTQWWPRAWRECRKPFHYDARPCLAWGYNHATSAFADLLLVDDDGKPLMKWEGPLAEDLLAALGCVSAQESRVMGCARVQRAAGIALLVLKKLLDRLR